MNGATALTGVDFSAWAGHAVLSVDEMVRADKAAMAAGVSGPDLMERAGAEVARAIVLRWRKRPAAVLCGPGNNGGDGFVAARHLAAAGWPVRLGLLGDRASLKGDAGWAAGTWRGPVEPLSPAILDGAGLVVDALYGAGLNRPLDGLGLAVVEAMAASGLPVVAVDVPSGLAGDTGAVLGAAAPAQLTVTFFRLKPGHLLLPGRILCGETQIADIGIPARVLDGIAPRLARNDPALWQAAMPAATPSGHKYTRGHVGVIGGAMMGAARLTAMAAARSGAGMVSLLVPPDRADAYAVAVPAALIVAGIEGPAALAAAMAERRIGALALGPGLGRGALARRWVEAALALDVPLVLDADALTALSGDGARLVQRRAATVLTPHDGEYARLFGSEAGDRLIRARAGAAETGAVLVLKGHDSVIAAPDGHAVVNASAPPWLATAGAGDVLTGIILGLIGQGMPPFAAAAAAVWRHGVAAQALGPGLLADDLLLFSNKNG